MSLAAATAVTSPCAASSSLPHRVPSSTVYLAAYAIRSSSTSSPWDAIPSLNPRSRPTLVEASCGPAMCAIRVWPCLARWVTAIRDPCSLSTETEGKL